MVKRLTVGETPAAPATAASLWETGGALARAPSDRPARLPEILNCPSDRAESAGAALDPEGRREQAHDLQFVVDEPASTECALDVAIFAPCASPSEHNGLSLGTHTFAVRATDEAGNQSATSFVWTVVAPPDTSPPVVVITGGPPSPHWSVRERSS